MKATGILRKVDNLGRIVIPIELRRTLGINIKDDMEIYVESESIILKKYEPISSTYGNDEQLVHPLEVDCHVRTTDEVAEQLNIREEEVISWRKQAPSVLITAPDPNAKPVANPPDPEIAIGEDGKKYYHLVIEVVSLLGFDKAYKNPREKVLRMLKKGLLDGFDACTFLNPEVKKEDFFPTCYWVYDASIEAYKREVLNKQ